MRLSTGKVHLGVEEGVRGMLREAHLLDGSLLVLFCSLPQAPLEAHRRRVRAGDIAPRLAHFESILRFLSQFSSCSSV